MADAPSISITWVNEAHDADRKRFAESLAARLGLSAPPQGVPSRPRTGIEPRADLHLAISDDLVELRTAGDRPGRGLFVDWRDLLPRRTAGAATVSRREPLGRAVGKETRTVLDATAGLGHDAALLAMMGFRVLAAERSPIIFALLEDGLRRAMADPMLANALGGRLQIINADARSLLTCTPSDDKSPLDFGLLDFWTFPPDVVYIDPMYPPKRKTSALAKKAIRMVRQVVGDDDDAAELLAAARQHARRVVVKRPTHAEPLAPDVTGSITSKLVRYDLYVRPA